MCCDLVCGLLVEFILTSLYSRYWPSAWIQKQCQQWLWSCLSMLARHAALRRSLPLWGAEMSELNSGFILVEAVMVFPRCRRTVASRQDGACLLSSCQHSSTLNTQVAFSSPPHSKSNMRALREMFIRPRQEHYSMIEPVSVLYKQQRPFFWLRRQMESLIWD